MPNLQLKGMSCPSDTRRNIFHLVVEREYCTNNVQHRTHKILAKLNTQCDYTIKKVWSSVSHKRIACEGTLVLFNNYTKCYDCCGDKPYVKFPVNIGFPARFEDALLTDGMPETVNLPYKGYKYSMLGITRTNVMTRVDLEGGKLLEMVYFNPSGIGFRTLQWNVVGESVTVLSVLYPKVPVRHGHQVDESKVKELAVFSLYPLQFVCKLTISKQIFGHNVANASIFLDLLVVMYSTGHIRMFSLLWILEKYRSHSLQLYDPLVGGLNYGSIKSPLTDNVKITDLPPVLFEVRCKDWDVMLTLPPVHYIMWPFNKNQAGYCCFSFENHCMVESGDISTPFELDPSEDRVILHADDSGRIVHMTNTQMRLLKLVKDEQKNRTKLVEDFNIVQSMAPKEPSLKVSKSGRIIKQRILPDSLTVPERTVLTMMYSEEFDMIILLSKLSPGTVTVCFYDNWSGKQLRQFVLDDALEEVSERALCVHLDTMVHVYKCETSSQWEVHVYKLTAVPD